MMIRSNFQSITHRLFTESNLGDRKFRSKSVGIALNFSFGGFRVGGGS